ncbi:MAG: hypothetical protein JRD04_10415, partial [Deltaproteobacteria bacterium]|nr:hypothetical protein [Deltaproteobacteria bacterium]
MMTGRFFSWNNATDFFHNRRGSATIWLIAAICFGVVFLGIVFLLSGNKMPDRKPPTVPAKFQAEIQESIKPRVASNEAPVEIETPDPEPGVVLEKELPEKPEEPLNADSSSVQDVPPEDLPGKGIPAQYPDKREPVVSLAAPKTPEVLSTLPPVKPPLLAEKSELTGKQLDPGHKKASPASPKSENKGVIEGIRTVVSDPHHAQIIFELNGYY